MHEKYFLILEIQSICIVYDIIYDIYMYVRYITEHYKFIFNVLKQLNKPFMITDRSTTRNYYGLSGYVYY